MRHVNNARYLRFLETGRMVHMRACTADIRNDEVKKALNGGTEGVGFIFGEVKYRYLVRSGPSPAEKGEVGADQA